MYLKYVTNCHIIGPMKNHIKKIRLDLGMSREEFSKALGLSVSSICHYESRSRHPRLSICYRIIDIARSNGLLIKLEDILPRNIQ